ncbi:apolipophorins [Bacillus rossius redtenbacheri]|uniref:apolipophorins n=1 Tax=Bacillus rossius redtenbacheri TaxID=93214 RepID=UPI002FDE6CFB
MGTTSTGRRPWAAWCLALLPLLATSASASSCSAGCKGGASNYPPGTVYVYEVEGTTRTSLPDTKDEPVTLQIHATAEVAGSQDCRVALKLKDVRVTGPGGKKYDSLRELEQYPVSYTSVDGKADSQLCTAEADSTAALNVKRGVISLLQVLAKQSGKVYEWDVYGKCPSSVVVDGGKNEHTITLTRDLNECYHRERINHRLKSTPYYTQSGVQSSPLLASTQTVVQKVTDGRVQTASSTETYLFRPLSNLGSGARTVVETKLRLKSHRSGSVQAGGATVARSILFELPRDGSSSEGSAEAVVKALRRAADTMAVTVGEDSAKEYRSLVKVVRKAGKEDLLAVYGQVKSGAGFSHSPKKLYQDALLQAGTGEAVEVAVELIKNNEIKGSLAELWYHTLSLVRQPSRDSIAAVTTLLDEPDLGTGAYLGIGALAGRYCSSHDCEGDAVLAGLLDRLARNLARGCKVSSRDQEDKLILSLKALGNVHHLTETVSTILQRCYADSSAPSRVRVAALETALTDACKHKKGAASVLENVQEDSELRIKAYLVLVQCPSGKMANSLKELLENEKINQVGSYIVSHLRNLRATTNPERQAAKEQLKEVRTNRRYPVDYRKYSRNVELSYLLDGINVGYSGEADIIYSQKSYLPRSVSLNLTSHVFGQSYNILELGVRAENLERILERYVGPRGYYAVTEPEQAIETNRGRLMSLVEQIKQRAQQVTRAKRSTSKQLSNTLKRATKSLGPDYEDSRIDLDLSAKVVGSEVAWKNVGDCIEDFSPEKTIDKLYDTVDEGIKKGKNINVDERMHATILEVELAYPTALGLPLKLVASASVAVHLQVDSNLDLPAVLRDPGNAELQIKIVPSAAVEVTGELLVDAYAVESGLKVRGRLHVATGTDIKARSSGGKLLDVRVGLPVQKQELVNLRSEVVSTVREQDGSEQDTPLTYNTDKKEYKGCFDQLANVLGLTFCSSVSVPWEGSKASQALYPLNGHSSLMVQMEAKDVPYYHLVVQKNLRAQYEGVIEVSLDTPGSQTNRKLGLVLTRLLEPEYKLALSLTSPRKTLAASLYEVDNAQEYSWNAKLVHDRDEYYARVGAKRSGPESHQTYTPLLEYRTPGETHQLSGGHTVKGIGCTGSVIVDKTETSRKYTLKAVTIQTPQGSLRVDGTLLRQKNHYESDLEITKDDDVIKYKSKFAHSSPGRYTIEAQGQSRKYPDWGIDVKWDYNREKDSLKNKLEVAHGRDLRSGQSRITLEQSAKYKVESYRSFDLEGENKLKYPLLGLDLEVKAAATPKTLSYDVELKYDSYKLGSELNLKRGAKQPGDLELDLSVEAGDRSIELDLKREVTGKDRSKLTAELEMKPGKKYELTADLVHAVRHDDVNLHQTSVLKVSDRPEDIRMISGLVVNRNELELLAELSYGRKQHVDIIWKLNKAADNPSGNVKVYVNGLVDANAQYKYVPNGKVGATLNIDLPKQGRKIKGTADLTITGTNHVASLDLFWDMGRDPSRKLHFSSESDIKTNSVDSKNTLVLLQEKITLNLKGSLAGRLDNGRLTGELDLTLPKGEQLQLRLDRDLKRSKDRVELEAKGDVVLLDAQGASNSLSIDGKLETEARNLLLDGYVRLAIKTAKGKDVSVYLKLKDVPDREKRGMEAQLDVDSSQLKPLRLGASADVTQKEVVYKAHGSYGSDLTATAAGTLGLGEAGRVLVKDEEGVAAVAFTLDNTLEVRLPLERARTSKHVTKLDVAVDRKSAKIGIREEVTVNGDKHYKLNANLDAQPTTASSLVEISLPEDKPRSMAATWHVSSENDMLKQGGTVTAKWGDKQEAVSTLELALPKDESGLDLRLTANTPKLGAAELTLKGQVGRTSPRYLHTQIAAVLNDKRLELDGKVSEGSYKLVPNVDVTAVSARGTSRLYLNLKQTGEDEVTGDSELQWVTGRGGRLTVNGEAKLHSVNNFYVELNADSEALQINKWILTAQSKHGSKGRNAIQVSATSAGKNVIDGRLNLNVVEKPNYHQIVAAGNVKLYEKSTQAKLEASIARLSKETNHEEGTEAKLKVDLGERSYDAVYKLTDRELLISNELCRTRAKQQCSVAKMNTKLQVDEEKGELHHSYLLVVDLKELIVVPESLEVTATTAITPAVPLDHRLEVKLSGNEEISYKAHVYAHKDESGVVITLPERVIAGKVQTRLVLDDRSTLVDLSLVGNVWLDQTRQPDLKTGLVVAYKAELANNEITVASEARLTHPALRKDLYVKLNAVIGDPLTKLLDGTLEVDLMQKREQAIKITTQCTGARLNEGHRINGAVKIHSQGLNLDISLIGHTEASASGVEHEAVLSYIDVKHATKQLISKLVADKNGLTVRVKGPDADLLSIEGKVQRPDAGTVTTQTLIRLVDIEPVMLVVDAKTTPALYVQIYKQRQPSAKAEAALVADIFSELAVRADTINDGVKKELVNAQVSLDEKTFLRTQLSWSTENIVKFLETCTSELDVPRHLKEAAVALGKEAQTELGDLVAVLRQARPDLKPLLESYRQQLQELQREISEDKAIKELSQYLNQMVGRARQGAAEVLEAITETVRAVTERLEKLHDAATEAWEKLLPELRKAYEKVVEVTTGVLEDVQTVLLAYARTVAKIVQNHEDDLKKLVSVVADVLEEIGKVIGKTVIQLRNDVRDMVHSIIEQIKKLPKLDVLKEKWNQIKEDIKALQLPEQIWIVLEELIVAAKDMAPTPELKDLVESLDKYINKHLNREKLDELAELQLLAGKLTSAVRSLITLVRAYVGEVKEAPTLLGIKLPTTVADLMKIPRLLVIHVSPLKYLMSDDLPTLEELLVTYRPRLNPLDWFPPYRAVAHVINGQHYITWDRRHYTFKGSCPYILVTDVVDGNLSVVLSAENGKLKSLLLTDGKDSIEVQEDRTLLVNGQKSEYPAHVGGLSAWRRYHWLSIKSDAGVTIDQDIESGSLTVRLSGYYYGRTRGLLGTLSYEPGDDLLQSNGELTENVNDFANSWKVGQCQDVSGAVHTAPKSALCTEYLTSGSSLSLAYPILSPAPYRDTCDLAVASAGSDAAKNRAACAVARAYASSAYEEDIPVLVPDKCGECEVVGQSPVEAGTKFSVRTAHAPHKAADVVIVLEQSQATEELSKELVGPLVKALTSELKSKGITDVVVHLMGWSDHQEWPQHYTTGGKLVYEGSTSNIKYYKSRETLPTSNQKEKIQYLLHELEVELGLTKLTAATWEILNYPYRAGASKALIYVVGQPSEVGQMTGGLIQTIGVALMQRWLNIQGIVPYVITPVEGLRVAAKDPKIVKNIVGYDNERVYSLTDGKKKQGNTELRKQLDYKSNPLSWLPQGAEGVTIVAQNFLDNKSQRRQYIQAVSHRISESLTAELYEDCMCIIKDGIYAESYCRVTGRKERETKSRQKTKSRRRRHNPFL